MRTDTATKISYGILAVAFTAMGIYHWYRASTGLGENIWVSVGYLILGLLGWRLLFVRFDRS